MEGYRQLIIDHIGRIFGDSNEFKFIIGCFFGLLGGIFDGRSEIVMAILLIYLADFFTGIAKQFFDKGNFVGWLIGWNKIKSRRIFRGIIKLAVYGVFLIIGRGMDIMMMTNTFFLSVFFVFIFLTDSVSVLENLKDLGFDVPVQVIDYIKKYLDKIFSNLPDKK